MYDHLKNEFPTHGLEIVFVSRDRDESSFGHYFRTMPWLSVPWNGQGDFRDQLSNRYDCSLKFIDTHLVFLNLTFGFNPLRFAIQGIPALLVLDSISGNIVVAQEQSRNEIMMACQGGEDEISRLFEQMWLNQVPLESKVSNCIFEKVAFAG